MSSLAQRSGKEPKLVIEDEYQDKPDPKIGKRPRHETIDACDMIGDASAARAVQRPARCRRARPCTSARRDQLERRRKARSKIICDRSGTYTKKCQDHHERHVQDTGGIERVATGPSPILWESSATALSVASGPSR